MIVDTAFEQLLQQHFPDIYQLHTLSKNEAHIWELLQIVLENHRTEVTGKIEIVFNRGHIEDINQTVKVLAYNRARPINKGKYDEA
jgi:hypothetical protein